MSLSQPKRGAYHHGDLASALVAEALRVVREQGFEAVSLRQVAHAVGVSPSAAYAHFADKDALLRAVAVEGEAALDRALADGVGSVPGDDDRSALLRFLRTGEAYLAWATSEPHLFRHTFGPHCQYQAARPQNLEEVRTIQADSVAFGLLQLGIADVKSRGLLRNPDSEGLELLLWTSVHGFSSLSLDGHLPLEAAQGLFGAILRTVFSDEAQLLLVEP